MNGLSGQARINPPDFLMRPAKSTDHCLYFGLERSIPGTGDVKMSGRICLFKSTS